MSVPPSHGGAALFAAAIDHPEPLEALDLAVASVLVVVAGAVSIGLRLGMERRLAVASVRMVAQLLVLGYALKWVFQLESVLVILPWLGLMVLAASRESVRRASRRYAGAHVRAFAALALSATLATFTATAVVIGVRPWWQPQYLIPFFGMALGNGLNSVSLTLDLLLEAVVERRGLIELDLALGATRWEALRQPISEAVRRGMVPIINAMTVAGLVSIPGILTGQILAGQDPLDAVRYQIVMMFMIAASSALAAVGIGLFCYRSLTSPRHQLLWERVRARRGE